MSGSASLHCRTLREAVDYLSEDDLRTIGFGEEELASLRSASCDPDDLRAAYESRLSTYRQARDQDS